MILFYFFLYLITFDCLLIIYIVKSTFTSFTASIYLFYLIIYCFLFTLLGLLLRIFRIKITNNFKFFERYRMSLNSFRLGYSGIISEWIGVLLHQGWFFIHWSLFCDFGIDLSIFRLVLKIFKAWGGLRNYGLIDHGLMSRRTIWRLLLNLYLALFFL